MIPCSKCKRHIHESDARCPFCGHSHETTANRWVALVGAMLMATALGSSGCSRDEPAGDEVGEGSVETDTETSADTTATTDTTTSADTDTTTDTTTADTDTTTDTTTTTADTTTTTTESESIGEEGVDDWGGEGEASFYAGPEDDWEDTGGWEWCDPFAQDCPEGEKCVPFIAFGNNYEANTCVPIIGDKEPGQACELFSPFEGTTAPAFAGTRTPRTRSGSVAPFAPGPRTSRCARRTRAA